MKPDLAMFTAQFDERLRRSPIIAILRGISTQESIAVAAALLDAGITLAEVPLNSPDPFTTIRVLREHFGERMAIGAGTVLTVADVERLVDTGCQFCVAPNTDADVIRASLANGMLPLPGFATASEAFAAIAAGARHLKAFPANAATLAAIRAVMPAGVQLIVVGGVTPEAVPSLVAAGAVAFGTGSDLYKPGRSAEAVGARAREWVAAVARTAPPSVELVCNPQATVGEGPVLHGGQILWVDPVGRRLLACKPHDGDWSQASMIEPVWSLGVLPDGTLVGNGEGAFLRIDAITGAVLSRGPVIDAGPGCRLNDLTVDSRGGLWGSSMHRGVLAGRGGVFHASSPDASAARVAEGLGVANGMAFSADERTLFVIDTLARTLLAYPADVVAGTLGEPVIVTDFLDLPGKPDGMAIAGDGSFWVAMWGAGEVVRIAPNGACVQRVRVPAPHVGSVCIGAGGELFVTTARARLSEAALAASPGSGGLFKVQVTASPPARG
ncbi:2-dehydro-3-deoxy-6-phosphogalactonate aldolase [Lysobacter sp. S4-A87]|uniref:2-dehydro-3-deoxy-6-phosphogalactonate aldolase n=1 Tax=Lysobacter sp. S4-A87 TaxID=2925843 RepID=UPI001F52E605|nr:2-dehydro-3-deoxy-6-phosphogalactonate aldolase [Lysobacter sp. S4-A87]UNK48531.1 2-dehydro-3-deoxy-6-phosphogalactonate aldolase [Lysobacter sp. S4-A87]